MTRKGISRPVLLANREVRRDERELVRPAAVSRRPRAGSSHSRTAVPSPSRSKYNATGFLSLSSTTDHCSVRQDRVVHQVELLHLLLDGLDKGDIRRRRCSEPPEGAVAQRIVRRGQAPDSAGRTRRSPSPRPGRPASARRSCGWGEERAPRSDGGESCHNQAMGIAMENSDFFIPHLDSSRPSARRPATSGFKPISREIRLCATSYRGRRRDRQVGNCTIDTDRRALYSETSLGMWFDGPTKGVSVYESGDFQGLRHPGSVPG